MLDERNLETTLSGVAVQILLLTDPHVVIRKDAEDLAHLIILSFLPELHSGILPDQHLLDVVSWVIQLENLGLGLLINAGIVNGLELRETCSVLEGIKRIFFQDGLALLYLPGGKQSPPQCPCSWVPAGKSQSPWHI